MITLMHGFNIEVYSALLGRTKIVYSTKEARTEGRKRRERAYAGLRSYIDVAAEKIRSGRSLWEGEKASQTPEQSS